MKNISTGLFGGKKIIQNNLNIHQEGKKMNWGYIPEMQCLATVTKIEDLESHALVRTSTKKPHGK